ncbi:hypothetical protein LINGRAPRIM_LOCUS2100 [Linum grandiflorum]
MAITGFRFIHFLVIFMLLFTFESQSSQAAVNSSSTVSRKGYIVFIDSTIIPNTRESHLHLLQTVLHGIEAEKCLYYDYYMLQGFAAVLSEIEAKDLTSVKGVLYIMPDESFDIDRDQTTLN